MRLVNYSPEKDFELLYLFFSNDENLAKISFPVVIRNRQEFDEYFKMKLNTSWREFRILEVGDGKHVGFAFSHDHSANHAYLSVGLFDQFQHSGYGAILAMLMLRYLFDSYPIEHVFQNVFAYNKESLELNRQGGAELVGTLPRIRFYQGDFHDMHIFATSRDRFEKLHLNRRC